MAEVAVFWAWITFNQRIPRQFHACDHRTKSKQRTIFGMVYKATAPERTNSCLNGRMLKGNDSPRFVIVVNKGCEARHRYCQIVALGFNKIAQI